MRLLKNEKWAEEKKTFQKKIIQCDAIMSVFFNFYIQRLISQWLSGFRKWIVLNCNILKMTVSVQDEMDAIIKTA
jgi:hypothetical protein